jgi:glycosyltransferase involved in cell wall biosynthesis
MKVLNVNYTIDPIKGGGTAERTLQMSRFLQKEGADCTILTVKDDVDPDSLKKYDSPKCVFLPVFFKRFNVPFRGLARISRLVKESDIVHIMSHWTLLNVLTWLFCKIHEKPYVVCPAGSLVIFGRSKPMKSLFNLLIGYRILREAAHRIAITQDEVEMLTEICGSSENITIVPNGIDVELYKVKNDEEFFKSYNVPHSKFLLFMGRLNPIKGIDLLINAFCEKKEELKDYNLLVAGPDEGMKEDLEKTIEKHDMKERIHFLGHVGGEKKSMALNACSGMVIPSRKEAMSIVVLEAGIVGKPVVLTDECGLNELQDSNAGIVVSPSLDGIKEGLDKYMIASKRDYGSNLQEYVLNNYTWDRVVLKYREIYQVLINKG